MGCSAPGSASGPNKKTETEIKFSTTNLRDLDIFFSGAKEVFEAVTKLTKDVREKKDNFFEATKFMEVPGASK
jgi:hypothetical protein